MNFSYIIIVLSLCLNVSQTQAMSIYWGKSETQGARHYMQDETLVKSSFGEKNDALFGIFDGHGVNGDKVAQFIASQLPQTLSLYMRSKKNPEKALTTTFKFIDNDILKNPCINISGSTALVAWLLKEQLYVAWTGDTRAVLARLNDGQLEFSWASVDHKPNLPKETRRILAANGWIDDWQNRIYSRSGFNLNMSRSLGDKTFKEVLTKEETDEKGLGPYTQTFECMMKTNGVFTAPLVIPDPDIHKIDLPDDSYLIIGSDGLWDVISNKGAVHLLNETMIPQKEMLCLSSLLENNKVQGNKPLLIKAAQKLRDNALALGSTDNISVLVVEFKKEDPITKPSTLFYKGRLKGSEGLKEINEIVKKSVKKGI